MTGEGETLVDTAALQATKATGPWHYAVRTAFTADAAFLIRVAAGIHDFTARLLCLVATQNALRLAADAIRPAAIHARDGTTACEAWPKFTDIDIACLFVRHRGTGNKSALSTNA